MTHDTSDREPFAGQGSAANMQEIILRQWQESAADFFRMACNPLSYVPQPLIPFLLKCNPWLSMFT